MHGFAKKIIYSFWNKVLYRFFHEFPRQLGIFQHSVKRSYMVQGQQCRSVLVFVCYRLRFDVTNTNVCMALLFCDCTVCTRKSIKTEKKVIINRFVFAKLIHASCYQHRLIVKVVSQKLLFAKKKFSFLKFDGKDWFSVSYEN